MNNCFTISLTGVFALLVNRAENEIHTPDVSPLKTVRDELPMAKITSTIEGEVDMRRKVCLVTISSPMHPLCVTYLVFVDLITLIIPGIPQTTHSPNSFAVGLCMRNASVICREKLLPPRA
jgi:hypothetical protein